MTLTVSDVKDNKLKRANKPQTCIDTTVMSDVHTASNQNVEPMSPSKYEFRVRKKRTESISSPKKSGNKERLASISQENLSPNMETIVEEKDEENIELNVMRANPTASRVLDYEVNPQEETEISKKLVRKRNFNIKSRILMN
jgi:hypothetical protein